MTRVGLCSVTFRDLPAGWVLERAAENGVEAIEWAGKADLDAKEPARLNDIAAASRGFGIVASSYGSYVRAGTKDALHQFDIALDATEALGARNMRVWAGTAARAATGADDYARAVRDLNDMSSAAKRRGVTVSVEYHRRTLTEFARDTVTLFEDVGSDNLFSYWQPVPGRGLAAWCEELDLLTDYLSDLHVFHWLPADGPDERRPLGEGIEGWRQVMQHRRHSARWPHPTTAYLEFVHDGSEGQFIEDMKHLRHLCSLDASQENLVPGETPKATN